MNALFVLTLLVQTAHSKVPSQAFFAQQAISDEQIYIRILSVMATPSEGSESVVAEAIVESVDHSKNGLKQGDTLTIQFTRLPPRPSVDGRQPKGANRSGPYLHKGESTCAFLNKQPDGTYSLGASNRSFPSECPTREKLQPHAPVLEKGNSTLPPFPQDAP